MQIAILSASVLILYIACTIYTENLLYGIRFNDYFMRLAIGVLKLMNYVVLPYTIVIEAVLSFSDNNSWEYYVNGVKDQIDYNKDLNKSYKYSKAWNVDDITLAERKLSGLCQICGDSPERKPTVCECDMIGFKTKSDMTVTEKLLNIRLWK